MYKQLLNKIKEYQNITLFRHQRPDGDAMFSVLSLYHFLKDNFKDKNIKVAGTEKYDVITKNDKISDSFIQKSLVIVIDTATATRIDDSRAMDGDYIIKIDHHPVVDNYGDLNIVDTNASAACELLAEILLSKEFSKYFISKKVYEYLYCGIVTDSLNFRTTSTTYKTFEIAAKLIKNGDLKTVELVEKLLDDELDVYLKITKIREYLTVNKKCVYVILDNNKLNKIGLDYAEAKNQISEIGTISDINIWFIAVESPNGLYEVSVRSKRKYAVNEICYKFGGGGHKNAAGIKNITKKDLKVLTNQLIELSTK